MGAGVTAWWRVHRKSVIAAAGAILALAVAVAPADKWVGLVVAVATAVGVYRVPNETAPAASVVLTVPGQSGKTATQKPPAV